MGIVSWPIMAAPRKQRSPQHDEQASPQQRDSASLQSWHLRLAAAVGSPEDCTMASESALRNSPQRAATMHKPAQASPSGLWEPVPVPRAADQSPSVGGDSDASRRSTATSRSG